MLNDTTEALTTAVARFRLLEDINDFLEKNTSVKSHQRRSKTGKVYTVKQHDREVKDFSSENA